MFASLLPGFAENDYTSYRLRRGGATWYFQPSLSLDATVTRGRWPCGKTAKQYIDEGTSQLAQVNFSSIQRARVKSWSEVLTAMPGKQEAEGVSPLFSF